MQSKPEYALNRNEPPGAGNTATALDIGHCEGVNAMPVSGNISPKGDSATQSETPPKNDGWQSIGSIAARLVAKAGAKK